MTTASATTSSALRRLMAPWLEHARRNIHLPIAASTRASDLSKDLWIHWNLPSSATMSALDVETMELLELYARVDYREAWAAIVRAADKSLYLEELLENLCTGNKNDEELLYPRFTIYGLEDAMYGLEDAMYNDNFQDTAKWLVLRVDPRDHSHTYYTTRETLLQCWADSHGSTFQRTPETRISLQLNVDLRGDDDREGGDCLLKEFATIASFTHDPAKLRDAQPEWNQLRTHSGLSVPVSDIFSIVCVDADFNSIAITDAMLTSTQEMMVDTRVHIVNLTLDRAGYEMADLTPQVTTPFFRTMLLPSTSTTAAVTSDASMSKLQPTSVELQCDVRFDVFQGACSALLASQSVRELSIHFPEIDSHGEDENEVNDESDEEKESDDEQEDDDDDNGIDFFEGEDHRLFWSWIAYALFSGESTHTVEDLSLRAFVLTESHVRVVKRVLRARDPLAYIAAVRKAPYKLPHLSRPLVDSQVKRTRATREPTVVDVSPGATLWLDKGGYDKMQTSGVNTETLRVVEDDEATNETHVCVIYPGAGVCWVNRSDIVARRVFSSDHDSAHSLRKLTIQITDNTSMTAVVQLLTLVGGTVETLTLHALRPVGVHDDDLRQLVAACPKLRHLDVGYLVMMDFAWLQGARLESLALSGVICARTSAYQRFLAVLATTDTALRLDLHELCIQREAAFLEQIAPRMMHLLDTNRRLARVFLSADTQEGSGEEASPRLVNAMQKRNGVALHVQKTPLPLRCTLAFLSVMRASGVSRQDQEHDDNDGRNYKRQCQQHLRVLPALHAPLVAIIAAFAAPHKHRVCGVVPFHKIW